MDLANVKNQDTTVDFLKQKNSLYETRNLNKDVKTNNVLDIVDIEKYKNYNKEVYCADINIDGIRKTWNKICTYIYNFGESNDFLNIANFGEMYEMALALENKENKKSSGQYYTPQDVAVVMSKWFDTSDAYNICDVGCGTGNLILAYFDYIGKEKTKEILRNGRLYLYDNDEVALCVCKTAILVRYGKEFSEAIHDIKCDFLDKNIKLPHNCKVISNPPYSTISEMSCDWNVTKILLDTKDMYSAFMEKIISQSVSSVIITPFSFIGGAKFYSLREFMNSYNGFIVSFDNVPGNIFRGRKHGIFNSNTTNSVRAAITVVENKNNINGFRLTPLIRFKSEERTRILDNDILERCVNQQYQIINDKKNIYEKSDERFNEINHSWFTKSNKKLTDYINKDGKYVLSVPSTCRYYTVAAKGTLNRKGQIILKFDNKDVFNYVYCMINSSFAYMFWRMYDGGITYPIRLLLNLPMFYDALTSEDKIFFAKMADKMINLSDKYIKIKENVGSQENIKFPTEFRDEINAHILKILCVNSDVRLFDIIHSNKAEGVYYDSIN